MYTTYIGVKQPLDTTTASTTAAMSVEEADKENETAIAKRNKLADENTTNTTAVE